MQPDLPAVKLTYQDLLLLPEDRNRHELIDGEHFVTPAPNVPHQTAVANLLRIIASFLHGRGLGRAWPSPIDVLFTEHDVVEPHLVFVAADRMDLVRRTHVHGAPDLLVEVLSDSTRSRDETAKRRLYEKHGVREYWLVDPDAETVAVLRLGPSGYPREPQLLRAGDILSTPLLPGLEIPITEIFE